VKDSASGNPAFDIHAIDSSTIPGLKQEQAHRPDSISKLVVQGIPVKNVQFTNSGMFVRSGVPIDTAYGVHREGGQGWFVQVKRFAWIDKQKVDFKLSNPVFQEEQPPMVAADAPAPGKAQPEDAPQAMDIDEVAVDSADKAQDDQIGHKASASAETVVSESGILAGDKAVRIDSASGGERGEVTNIPVTIQAEANGAATGSTNIPISDSKLEGALTAGPKSPASTEFKIVESAQEAATKPIVEEIIAVKLEMGNELEASIKPMTFPMRESRQIDEGDKQDVKREQADASDIQKA
jgi:hypothetical protein